MIPAEGFWCLAYFVVIHSVTTYFLMLWCNKFIDASIISAYSAFQPVASTVVALIFLHEVCILDISSFAISFVNVVEARSGRSGSHSYLNRIGFCIV